MSAKKNKTITFQPLEEKTLMLLALVGNSMFHTDHPLTKKTLDTKQAAELCMEARSQAVAALAFDGFTEPSALLEPKAYKGWLTIAKSGILNGESVFRLHADITKALNEANIPYVILKGCASAMCYSKPHLRVMGDLDFLVHKEDMEKAGKLLEGLGYTRHTSCAHHIDYEKEGSAPVELHFAPPGIPFGTPAEEPVKRITDRLVDTAIEVPFDDFTLKVPEPVSQFFVLLLHLHNHLVSLGIGLRHLCDLAAFFADKVTVELWENELAPRLRECGLYTLSCALLMGAERYLGMPNNGVAFEADASASEMLVRDILSGGNFGRKDESRAASHYFVTSEYRTDTNKGMLAQMWESLLWVAKSRFPITKRFPVLHIFAVPASICIYFYRVITGKRVFLGAKEIAHANERRDLYNRLEMFEIK